MKSTTLIVLGGLLFAGTSLAAEPQPQAAGASLKIGIDPVTGQRRALTGEESAALDAQQSQAGNNLQAKAKSAKASNAMLSRFPATDAEAMAGAVKGNGVVAMKPSLESISSITVTRDSQGKLTFSENGEAMTQKQEAASE